MGLNLPSQNTETQLVSQHQLIDDGQWDEFNSVLLLAKEISGASVAAIAYPDNGRTLFLASHGISQTNFDWAVPFNQHEPLVINDTLADKYWLGNLTSTTQIRFYISIPLTNIEAFPQVCLCIMDDQPHAVTQKQIYTLKLLAQQASTIFKLKANNAALKKQEENLNSSEEEMKIIFQNAIDAVVVLDDKGIISQWNPKAELIFGWTADEVIKKPFHEIILPQRFHEKYLQLMQNYTSDTEALVNNKSNDISALRKDGSEFDIALGISPANIKGRRFCICFINDITDRKQVNQQLDKQKEFYENILNKIPTDIAVFDANHRYLFVNPGAISIEEYRKYIIGKDDYEYAAYRNRDISTAHSRREKFLQVKATGKEIRWEDNLKDPKGNMITHLRRMFPVHDENGELSMVIGFGIDITERKIMEEKQAALVRQLSAQNTQLVDFCNIVSHNLRAPLVNMSMLVQFIEETPEPAEQKLLISKLNPVIENLNTTFNELVESIQIKQDLEIQSEHIPLTDCIQRTLEVLESEINKSGAVIDVDFKEASTIYFPPKYLYSIFHNLISNSLKYQSPKRKPLIKIATKRIDNGIVLSVNDNGLGIDLNKHKDNFFKIGKVFHRHPNAKGFGLYMTKTQVEAMNGKIWLESTPDVGTTFFIEFTNQKP